MSATRRIALILTIVFLIPALFFSVYEISSLTKDEKMIESIYQKQLEAILFSVNQISDATVSSWAVKTEVGQAQKNGDEPLTPALYNLLSLNSSIVCAFVIDTVAGKPSVTLFSIDSALANAKRPAVEAMLRESTGQIEQILKYRKSGFQKIEASVSADPSIQYLIFITEGSTHPWQVAGLAIDPELFIEDVVGSHLNKISKEQLTLGVFNKKSGNRVYSTEVRDSTTLSGAALIKDLWIFPNYALAISPKGTSIQQLVRQRTTTNLYLLIGLDAVLIVAMVLAFRSVKKEVQLAQNKADFVANVSHEIRTPLALISMFAETLEMGRVTSEQKKQEYYGIINKETHRLTGIVNKILSFSQTESGKKKLQLRPVLLNEVVEDILHTYDFHLKNKGFEYLFRSSEKIEVLADREALTEIIVNLIDNAMKYSVDVKKIEIDAEKNSDVGLLRVKDYGIGISAADQKHIFDKFYRVSTGDLAKARGTGLGLSLVKQLLEQQNGKITVNSELGKGSVFVVYLPLEKGSQNIEVRIVDN